MNKDLFDTSDFSHKEFLDDFKTPWEAIKNLDDYLSERTEGRLIGEGTIIDTAVKIEGKVIIGKNCKIADNVLIREGCLIGDNVSIGHSCEIKHSIILNNTAIAHFNYVGDSLIGSNVNIGGGAIIANWRFDEGEVRVKAGDSKINTGLTKFGAAIGDGSKLGSNCVVNPGTIIGKRSWIFPLVSAFGTYSAESRIK